MVDITGLTKRELKTIATEYKLNGITKKELVKSIEDHYYELKKYIPYTYIKQLGVEGKDGRTFLVQDKSKQYYALKLFKKNKHNSKIKKEVDLQIQASKYGISPKIIEYDTRGKYIVMEKLDDTLYHYFVKQGGELTLYQQKSVVKLFEKLDQAGVLHGDPNILNFMKKGNRWYMIDYGFASKITNTTLRRYGNHPNVTAMTMGLIIQCRKLNPNSKLEYLEDILKTHPL